MFVRFTEIITGKVTHPVCETAERAKQLYRYAVKVATAEFLIELVDGDHVLKSYLVDFQPTYQPA